MHDRPVKIPLFRLQSFLASVSLSKTIPHLLVHSLTVFKPYARGLCKHLRVIYTMVVTNLGLPVRVYTMIFACWFLSPTLVVSQLCYDPSGGSLDNFGICNNASSASVCCPVSNECMSNGLCLNPLSGNFNRGGCTDNSFKDPVCPSFCTAGRLSCLDLSIPHSSH